jgi:hypothetical protein
MVRVRVKLRRCCADLLYVADVATCDETRIACEVVVLTTINSRRLAVSVPRQRVSRSGTLRRNE